MGVILLDSFGTEAFLNEDQTLRTPACVIVPLRF